MLTDAQIAILESFRKGTAGALGSLPPEKAANVHVTVKATDLRDVIDAVDLLRSKVPANGK